jgi:predicted CXXCH cytochrome family protein
MKRNLLLVSCLAALAAASCDERKARTATSAPAETPVYAGSASCVDCHVKEFREWKGSHHQLAMRDIDPKLDNEAFAPTRTIKHASQTSTAEVKDGKLTLTTLGPDGGQHGYVPAFALGVEPVRQYLMPFPDGRLQVTELAFDPAKKDWFDVYNDEDRKNTDWGHWSNRGMNWNSMCATCHTTVYQKNYDATADAYKSAYQEMGVGCEQCHGPMKTHNDWQYAHGGKARIASTAPALDAARAVSPGPVAGADPTRASSPGSENSFASENTKPSLLAPGFSPDPTLVKLDGPQYFNTCAACHSRRSDLTGDFRAGQNYLDHYGLVLPDLTNTFYPDGQIWDEDFEITAFTLSYMHRQGIRCTDCHNPHTGKRKLEGDALCLRCHFAPVTNKIAITAEHSHHPAGKGGSLCTDCHMPQTVYMARHWRHDHGMTIPDPLLTKQHGIPNACNRCHADKTVDWSLEYMDKWYGGRMDRIGRKRGQLLARIKAGDLSAVPGTIDLLRDEKNSSWRAVYAKFLLAALEDGRSRELVEQVGGELFKMLDDEAPMAQASAIESLDPIVPGGFGAVSPDKLHAKLTELLKSPSRLVRVRAAWALRRQLPEGQARDELKAAMRYSEDQPLGAFQWAQFYVDGGQPEKALPWFEKAVAWDPAAVPFRHSYAMTLDALGRPMDALVQAKKAAELDPQQGAHQYALGLLYAELGQLEESRTALQAATQRDPNHPRYWYNLGLAEAKLNNLQPAVDALARAEKLDPQEPGYPFARATILLQNNRNEEAKAALQRVLQIAPNHPQARALLNGM